jgi:hypothetical protein
LDTKRRTWEVFKETEITLAGTGLVFKAEHYMYNSAADYSGENGLLEIIMIE